MPASDGMSLTGRSLALGVGAMVLSAACWGFATVMSKGALFYFPPFTLLALQLATSIAFLWFAVVLTGRATRLDRGARLASLSGILEPGLAYAFGIAGLALTGAANASLIGTTEPLLIIGLAWLFLRERTSTAGVWAIMIAMLGVAMVSLPDTVTSTFENPLVGDLLVFLGTTFAALYVVVTSRLVTTIEPLPLAALQQSVGFLFAVLLLAGALAFGFERLPAWPPVEAFLLAAASGIVQYALAFWFYLFGLRILTASFAALFLALIPVFGVGGAVLFLGEPMAATQWFGSLLIIATVASMARRGSM